MLIITGTYISKFLVRSLHAKPTLYRLYYHSSREERQRFVNITKLYGFLSFLMFEKYHSLYVPGILLRDIMVVNSELFLGIGHVYKRGPQGEQETIAGTQLICICTCLICLRSSNILSVYDLSAEKCLM